MTYEETIEWIFLSTLSLRRATGDAFYLDLVSGISIHALLAESDVFCQCKKRVGSCISIHALLAESDNHATLDAGGNDLFLSTLSLRRATVGQIACGEPITAISIHALLAESDGRTILSGADISDFYPRSPCGERPALCRYAMVSAPHFYPRSPCGERPGCASGNPARRPFLSTLSLRRATFFAIFKPQILTYFYPRSPCGERRHWQTGQSRTRQFLSTLSLRRATVGDTPPCCGCMISIHALLAESDLTFTFTLILLSVISIHALLAESDFKANVHRAKSRLFLSTLSLRRATILCVLPVVQHTDFYPRSPCGERQTRSKRINRNVTFLSTLSLRRATLYSGKQERPPQNFYPRSPCGERQGQNERSFVLCPFLSTLSLRRATGHTHYMGVYEQISIHALLAESDCSSPLMWPWSPLFLSTLSLRRATGTFGRHTCSGKYFYPRSPCGERPPYRFVYGRVSRFLSTLSLRRATPAAKSVAGYKIFLSTLSLRRATRFLWDF